MAVANGTAAAARQLLQSGARLEAAADRFEGGTPLHVASRLGQAKLVKMLLEWKANAFARDSKDRTPLDVAMEYKVPRAIEAFCVAGVTLESQASLHSESFTIFFRVSEVKSSENGGS